MRGRAVTAPKTCVVVQWLTVNSVEATNVAAIDALFASINPAVTQGRDLTVALTKAVDVANEMPHRSQGLRRALYPAVTKLFERIRASAQTLPGLEVHELKILLFGPDAEIEAIRLLRAETVVAVVKALPALAEEVRSEVEALKREERSAVVQARLDSATLPAHSTSSAN